MTRPTILFRTLGCRLNQAETATLRRCFEAKGYPVTDCGEAADVVVINTCTVTAKGDADTRRLVHKVNRENPGAEIALIGCQAQLQSESLARLPRVGWVVGNARKFELPEIIEAERANGKAKILLGELPRESFTMPAAGIDQRRTRANLKIQDGCDFYCLYCEVPYARGHARSRVFEDIAAEAKTLIRAGHRELVLTGINIGCYKFGGKRFVDVVKALLDLDGLERLRISSIEPTTIPAELLPLMRDQAKFCRHLHVPIQSGSDAVLARMGRRYTVAEFSEFMLEAVETVPGICFATDIIAGYPGETGEDFELTRKTLENLPFAYFHVFSYSERKQAKSKDLADPKVPPAAIRARSKVLHELSDRKRRAFMAPFLRTAPAVLVEERKAGLWTGLTDNYIRVSFPSERELANEIIQVKLESLTPQGMVGRL